jgi:MFS family permease
MSLRDRFAAKEALTEQEIDSALKTFIKDGLASQAMSKLTEGAFFVAFALQLGASNLVIGLLAAIPPFVQLIQLPSIYLVEKIRNRRLISVIASTVSRIVLLLIAGIPFLASEEDSLLILIGAMIFSTAFAAISSCSWNSWMRDLIPEEKLGYYYSRRMAYATTVALVLSLLGGYFIDYWRTAFSEYEEIFGYSILFLIGCIAGIAGIYFIAKIPEPKMRASNEKLKIYKLVFEPFRDSNFKNLIMFLSSWNFAANLAAPFFTVYMLQRLQLDMLLIIALNAASKIINLLFLRIWGRFADQFSNKTVLGICGPLFFMCILAFTFTTLPEKHVLTIPLLIVIHIFVGISTAGVTLASGTIGLKLAPQEKATAYLAANSFVNSLAAGFAPILGGLFADFFAARELSWTLQWKTPEGMTSFQTLNLQQWDFFFSFAFLIGLYSIHRLALVKEVRKVETRTPIKELIVEVRREMRNLSTVEGLRQMVQFPFGIIKSKEKR